MQAENSSSMSLKRLSPIRVGAGSRAKEMRSDTVPDPSPRDEEVDDKNPQEEGILGNPDETKRPQMIYQKLVNAKRVETAELLETNGSVTPNSTENCEDVEQIILDPLLESEVDRKELEEEVGDEDSEPKRKKRGKQRLAKSVKPAKSVKSAKSAKPVKSVKLAKSVKSVKPAKLAKSILVESGEESSEDEYPHHEARVGSKYQVAVPSFEAGHPYESQRPPCDVQWIPGCVNPNDLDVFMRAFPADIAESVYDVITECKFDLDRAYEKLLKSPPINPVTQHDPEKLHLLEENTDNMGIQNYFPNMKTTELVDLFYHMDASFKDDVCSICSSAGSLIFCSRCPRGFHRPCIKYQTIIKDFICPYCLANKETMSVSEIDTTFGRYKKYIEGKQHQQKLTKKE